VSPLQHRLKRARATTLFCWWPRQIQIMAHPRRPAKRWAVEDVPAHLIGWSQYLSPPGFRALLSRWVVERTFAWQGQHRRLSKDEERLCATSETLTYLAMLASCSDSSLASGSFSDDFSSKMLLQTGRLNRDV
jgi:hypothetical protein